MTREERAAEGPERPLGKIDPEDATNMASQKLQKTTIMNNISAIVLAAGASTRMKTDLPKVLHKIGARTILDRVISNVKNAGIRDIIVVIGYKKKDIQAECGEKVKFAVQKELLGSADAVKTGIKKIKKQAERVLVICGDAPLITGKIIKDIIKKNKKENAACTMLTCKTENPFSYGRIIRDKNGGITGIIEEKDLSSGQKSINEINTGTYCFRKKELAHFIGNIRKNAKKGEFYLTDIIGLYSDNGERINSVDCSRQEAIGINSRKELAEVNKIIHERTIERLMSEGVTVVDPETTHIDASARIAPDTIVFPNTVIEGNVNIGKRCRIGPFARLRNNTKIDDEAEIGNFVELVRTKVGKRTRIKHHTYMGDAVIGSDVNVGAGVITANYDGKRKNRTIIENGAFIGAGTILIAPVTIGKKARSGAGSVITRNRNVKAGEIVAGVPAKPFKKK